MNKESISHAAAVGVLVIDWENRKLAVAGIGGPEVANEMTVQEVMDWVSKPVKPGTEVFATALSVYRNRNGGSPATCYQLDVLTRDQIEASSPEGGMRNEESDERRPVV